MWCKIGQIRQDKLIFDVAVFTSCVILYCINQFGLKSLIGGEILTCHFNDFIAIVALLSFANVLATILNTPRFIITRLRYTLLITMVCSIYWEFITPLYKTSTTDWRDIVFYLLGALLYWAIRHIKEALLIIRN